jgi:(4S)-4-hydroxy-5-phosphonooxypentane-2,3-dione isomerase
MNKVALNVVIEFEPDSKEDILRALLSHRERCLQEEPGTLQFEVLVPSGEPTKLFLFELYTDAAALSAHSAGPSIAAYRDDVKGKISNVKATLCSLGNEKTA